jgi:hypothetical protein
MKQKIEKKFTDIKEKSSCESSHYDFFIYNGAPLLPGIVRLRDAPHYLGMNKTYFRDQVQPFLTRIRIDKKGIGFARTELDRWIVYAQTAFGQPPAQTPPWENQDLASAHTTRSLFTAQPGKPPRKTIVKKSSVLGKPTVNDLEHLVGKIISEETDRQKVKP